MSLGKSPGFFHTQNRHNKNHFEGKTSPWPREDKFKTADILCISDFGWVGIEDYVKGLIDEQKSAGMKFYGLNIGGTFGGRKELKEEMWDDGKSPMSVCGSVWEYHAGRCVEVKKRSLREIATLQRFAQVQKDF